MAWYWWTLVGFGGVGFLYTFYRLLCHIEWIDGIDLVDALADLVVCCIEGVGDGIGGVCEGIGDAFSGDGGDSGGGSGSGGDGGGD